MKIGSHSYRRTFYLLVCAAFLGGAGTLSAKSPTVGKPGAPAPAPMTGGPAIDPAEIGPPRLSPEGARQIQAVKDIKNAKTAAQKKIDSRLFLGLLHERKDPRLAPLTDFRFVKPAADGRVAVELLIAPTGFPRVMTRLRALGDVVTNASPAHLIIHARVRLADLEVLAASHDVRRVATEIPMTTMGTYDFEGDAVHGAAEARTYFGADGTGVKVCVISDGVNSLATLQAGGFLPASVEVLAGQAGSGDEGTEMLAVIHQLAPGADLAFATGQPDEPTLLANLTALGADGCNIIVDDTTYINEPVFEDSQISDEVNTIVGNGVLFFGAAGNLDNKDSALSGTWEGDFKHTSAATPAPLAGASLNDFGDGGASILVTSCDGQPVLLNWAEHYTLTQGFAATDFDLYDMDGGLTTIFDASTDTQDGTGGDDFPVEIIGGGTFSGERLLIDNFAGPTTMEMHLAIYASGNSLSASALDPALATYGATFGHNAAASAITVGAVDVAEAYPDLFTATNVVDSYSADGPRRVLLDSNGNEYTAGNRTSTGGIVRDKPDLVAADGVTVITTLGSTFYGTSAAAAHAAAIAALVESAVPGSTVASVTTALTTSAIDIMAAGQDMDSGYGIVMAHASLAAAGATPKAFFTAGAAQPTEVAGDGDAFMEPNEDWSLVLPLENIGGASGTGITATLSSTSPGVQIVTATSTYPDADISATVDYDAPFVYHLTTVAVCGGFIDFTLTVTYSGRNGSAQTVDYKFQLGGPGTPVTVAYTGPVTAIPDGVDLTGTNPGAVASTTVGVEGIAGNVYELIFEIGGTTCDTDAGSTTVGLDHSFVHDLELSLASPAATQILLVSQVGGGGNNFCQTDLDDDGEDGDIQDVTASQAPFTGSFIPDTLLSTFAGQVADGTWTFSAQDFYVEDTGNIRDWSITITPAVCDASVQPAVVTATKTVSGSFASGGTVTYTIVLTNIGPGVTTTDGTGHELTDILPAGLTLVSASATAGTASTSGNEVDWDGALVGVDASTTITITATINAGSGGDVISNQAVAVYDSTRSGTNDTDISSDDPGVSGVADPTSFTVARDLSSTLLDPDPNPALGGQLVTLTATVSPASATGTVTFFDGTTLLGSRNVTAGVATFTTSTLASGTHHLSAVYSGDTHVAGNTSLIVDEVIQSTTTMTTLTASENPSPFATAIILTATVDAAAGGPPTGTVTFKDGNSVVGTGTLTDGVATLSTTPTLGTHEYTAVYPGAPGFQGSTSAVTEHMVVNAPTRTILASDKNPSVFGQAVDLTATVTSSDAPGTVTFKEGSTILGTATLAGGTATLTLSNLAAGTHAIVAAYDGQAPFAASTSPAIQQVVTQATSTVILVSSLNPSTAGTSITLTANVTPASATGTVTFFNGTTSLGTATITGGMATLTIASLPLGTASITAVYSGNTNYSGATSTALSQVVNVTPLTTSMTALSVSPNPATFSQSVNFTATVTPAGATGTVVFQQGGTILATVPIVGGVATFTTSMFGVGSQSITATYSGDSTFAGSSSTAVTESVTAAATVTVLTPGENPASISPVDVTATVTSAAGTPTGTVTFLDGTSTIATAPLVNGMVTVPANLTIGNHSLTATYDGATDFASSTSAVVHEVIEPFADDGGGPPPIDARPVMIDAALPPDVAIVPDAAVHPDATPVTTPDARLADAAIATTPDAGAAATKSSSGCGCEVGPSRPVTPAAVLLVLAGLGAFALARRRRRA